MIHLDAGRQQQPGQRPAWDRQQEGRRDDDALEDIDREDLYIALDADEGSEDDSSTVDHDEEPIPERLSIDDPRRMHLTVEERQWALDIKDAVKSTAELDDLSDFMYAQLAIITRGNLEDAIRRVTGLQYYRQEYNILDTLQDGCRQMKKMIDLFPRQLLSFSFSVNEGTYVLIHDMTELDTTALNTPEKARSWMAGSYYIHATMCPDMASIRRGSITLIEWYVLDFNWRWNNARTIEI